MAITVDISGGKNDKVFGKSQVPMKNYIITQAEAFEQESALKLLVREETSKHWAEEYGGETGIDNFQPTGNGGTYPQADFEDGYGKSIKNMTWKQSFSVTKEMVEDAQIGKMQQRARKLIKAYYRTREMYIRYMYAGALKGTTVQFGNKAFDVSCADNLALFSKVHPCKVTGKKQCNLYKDAFSKAALSAVETEMQNRRGDNGEILAITPDTIWIPNDGALKDQVFEVIGADKNPENSNNGFNFHYGRWNVIVDPYLTQALGDLAVTDTPWFLLDSKFIQDENGAILQNRVDLSVQSDVDKTNDNNIWKGRGRFGAGFVSPNFISVGGMTSGTQLVGP